MQIDQAIFQNSFVDTLPGESGDNRPRQVPGYCYSRVSPTSVADPHLLAWSDDLANDLGIDRPPPRGASVDLLGGNLITPTMKPFAARYGGHQFGSWAGQLGDGRAISLGELTAGDGSTWEIQLKGAGPTPYSRFADGRAVLRSSLREFVCSEAMHHLGVPTTRALSLVGTGETVVRDMFYNGDPRPEPGAIVARVAPTFVRFGNFEIFASRREQANLQALADYVIGRFFPELGPPSETTYVAWFQEVARRTAVLIAKWTTVGFVHGVMNTDNMSILGLTIDYGPYGWLEPFDPEWTPNTTDFGQRRYAFGQQPDIGLWNVAMLGRAISLLVSDREQLLSGLQTYQSTFLRARNEMMRAKLGLGSSEDGDESLIDDLLPAMADAQVDMTNFFRKLSDDVVLHLDDDPSAPQLDVELVTATSYIPDAGESHFDRLVEWLNRYRSRLRRESVRPDELTRRMHQANPKYVLRNYLAQEAIDRAEAGDLSKLETLMAVLAKPFDEQPEHDQLSNNRPEWAATRPGCATLSCSS